MAFGAGMLISALSINLVDKLTSMLRQ
jgi:hypothetical protein